MPERLAEFRKRECTNYYYYRFKGVQRWRKFLTNFKYEHRISTIIKDELFNSLSLQSSNKELFCRIEL